MNKILKKIKISEILKRALGVLRLIFIFYVVLYALIRVYRVFGLPYPLEKFLPIEWLPNIFRATSAAQVKILWGTETVDLTYFFSALSAFLFSCLCGFLLRVIDVIEYNRRLRYLETRKKDEADLNNELELERNELFSKYTAFVALLGFELEYTLDVNQSEMNDTDRNKILNISYDVIKSELIMPPGSKLRIVNNKLLIFSPKFDAFDNFTDQLIGLIRVIYQKNKEYRFRMSFNLSVDAVETSCNIALVSEMLEKISSFKYRNKIIVTFGFVARYKQLPYSKYLAKTMGISRFTAKSGSNANGGYDSEDFELYSLHNKIKP